MPNSCTAIKKSCISPCPGYGTQTFCPPLIVIATLSTEQAKQQVASAR